jgi:hypothetical protein
VLDRRSRNGPEALDPRLEGLAELAVGEAEKSTVAADDDGESLCAFPGARRGLGPASPSSRRARHGRAPGRPVLAEGMLKLMLILLAFFVFLHSRSELSQERVAPILDSLALRFASTVATGSDDAARATALHLDPGILLRRRVVGHLPISAGEVEVPGALLAFDLDETSLFAPETALIVRDRLVLLHRLAHALDQHEAGPGSVLVVTTGWPDAATPLTAARLRTLEAIFADTTLAASRVRLGVATLPAGIWRFSIRAAHGQAA